MFTRLTDAELDAIIARDDARDEARSAFEEAHSLTRDHMAPGDDYRATFGASLRETRKRRARRESERAHREWFRATYCK